MSNTIYENNANLKNLDKETKEYFKALKNKPSEDIAEIIEDWEPQKRVIFLQTLNKEEFADVFYFSDQEVKESILSTLKQPEMIELLEELASEELVDTLQELPANVVNGLLAKIEPERRKEINALLKYPEESVGSLMSVDFVKVKEGWGRSKIREKLLHADVDAEHLSEIYIVDDSRKLTGVLPLGDFVQAEREDVSELIKTDFVTVEARDDQETAAQKFSKYHRIILPVVDGEKRMVGVITADDIYEVIEDELYEDMSSMHGVSAQGEEEYLDTPVEYFYRSRITWLLFLMISAIFTGMVMSRYEHVLAANVALAAFIPMLMDSSGNAGSQASTTVIRAVTLGEIDGHSIFEVMWKELRIGLMCGATMALVNFVRMKIFTGASLVMSITVSLTLIAAITIAKVIGGMLPIIAAKIKQDPAVMAGPLLTTIADTITLFIFFHIQQIIMGL